MTQPCSGPGVETPLRSTSRLQTRSRRLHHGGLIDYGPPGLSYYYSRTRLAVQGDLVTSDASPEHVTGEAWMDHQWGNFVVAGGGWDWFSLQLDDQSEVMLYVLRDANGTTISIVGTQVMPDGSVHQFNDLAPQPLGQWRSPHTGATYPSGWQLALPDGRYLEIEPVLQDQELYFPTSAARSTGKARCVSPAPRRARDT
jgi:predicted secreted hydrolase